MYKQPTERSRTSENASWTTHGSPRTATSPTISRRHKHSYWRDAAGTISEYLLSQQRDHGGFADDADAMDTVDQTAELACWLRMLPELAAATQPVSLTVAGF